MAQDVLMRMKGISKVYHMGERSFYALNHVDLDIAQGEFLTVLGPSGSGKSTLLNIIGATDRPTTGTQHFLDQDLTAATDYQRTLYRRHEVGFIFQFYNLIPTLTALENVEVSAAISRHPLNPVEVLDWVELKDFTRHFPAQMSGGEQQRVAIARALAGDPRILLCDEPTGALDSHTGRKVLGLLVHLCRQFNKSVLLITHNAELSKLGDRVIYLKDGHVEKIITQKHPLPAEQLDS